MLVSGDEQIDKMFDKLSYKDIQKAFKRKENIYLAIGQTDKGEVFLGTKLLSAYDIMTVPKTLRKVTMIGKVDISSLVSGV